MIYIQLFWLFARVGLFTIGGGLAMIPLVQQALIDQNLMTLSETVDMVALSQMTPGPFAVNAATFVGMRLYGIPGSLVATLGVMAPSLVITMLIVKFFFTIHKKPLTQAVMSGIRPVVVALVGTAVWSMGREALLRGDGFWGLNIPSLLIAATVVVLMLKTKINPALLILISGAAGILFLR